MTCLTFTIHWLICSFSGVVERRVDGVGLHIVYVLCMSRRAQHCATFQMLYQIPRSRIGKLECCVQCFTMLCWKMQLTQAVFILWAQST